MRAPVTAHAVTVAHDHSEERDEGIAVISKILTRPLVGKEKKAESNSNSHIRHIEPLENRRMTRSCSRLRI